MGRIVKKTKNKIEKFQLKKCYFFPNFSNIYKSSPSIFGILLQLDNFYICHLIRNLRIYYIFKCVRKNKIDSFKFKNEFLPASTF